MDTNTLYKAVHLLYYVQYDNLFLICLTKHPR